MKSVKFKKIDNKYNETEDQATETNRKETSILSCYNYFR